MLPNAFGWDADSAIHRRRTWKGSMSRMKRGWLAPIGAVAAAMLVLAGGASASAFSAAPPGAQGKQIFGTYSGTADVHAPAPLGPYSGTVTARVGSGPLAGSTLVAVYTVNRSYNSLIDPNAVNSVVISNPGGALTGVATSYQFSPDPPCANQGCVTRGAVLTISITGGTRRFACITGGELTMTQDVTFLDNGFFNDPIVFAETMSGTLTGSLTR